MSVFTVLATSKVAAGVLAAGTLAVGGTGAAAVSGALPTQAQQTWVSAPPSPTPAWTLPPRHSPRCPSLPRATPTSRATAPTSWPRPTPQPRPVPRVRVPCPLTPPSLRSPPFRPLPQYPPSRPFRVSTARTPFPLFLLFPPWAATPSTPRQFRPAKAHWLVWTAAAAAVRAAGRGAHLWKSAPGKPAKRQ